MQSYEEDPEKPGKVEVKKTAKDWSYYKGRPALVIAIDLGTTFSGASYCILQPHTKPVINDVVSFPGQQTSSSKIPSVVLYSSSGEPRLYGAEALGGTVAERLLDEGGALAKRWKLYLKPSHMPMVRADGEKYNEDEEKQDCLPFKLEPETVCAHFLAYMAACVGTYIRQRQEQGAAVLASLASNIQYVITLPNGWDVVQQNILRKACIVAGLIMPEQAGSISFVSEAEASINFCTMPGRQSNLDEIGRAIVVADCGGGTIDVSSYRVEGVMPSLRLAETTTSDCLMAGSITVDRRARQMLQERLQGTAWDNTEELQSLESKFCSSVKEIFADAERDYYLPIGRASENDDAIGIKRGKLVIKGIDIASLFEPCVAATEQAIRKHIASNRGSMVTVAMVGGFSESTYLRNELQKRLGSKTELFKPDEALSKAVAKGAVAWQLDSVVSSRVARMTYGIRCSTRYKSNKSDHRSRKVDSYIGKDGAEWIGNVFSRILDKGMEENEEVDHVERFSLTWGLNVPLHRDISLVVYRGTDSVIPEFINDDDFETLCKFRVDLEPFRSLFAPMIGKGGKPFIRAPIQLGMKLSGTEITAETIFSHGDQIFRTPAVTFSDD